MNLGDKINIEIEGTLKTAEVISLLEKENKRFVIQHMMKRLIQINYMHQL